MGILPLTQILLCICRAKHLVKVHVWAGRKNWNMHIRRNHEYSWYVEIPEQALIPFIQDVFPGSIVALYRTMTPSIQVTMLKIIFFRRASTGGSCIRIQNLWHELKEFQRREVKPHSKQEFVDGKMKWTMVESLRDLKTMDSSMGFYMVRSSIELMVTESHEFDSTSSAAE